MQQYWLIVVGDTLCTMHHELYLHIVWTTRDRSPSIDLSRATYLQQHVPVIVRQERGRVLEIGIVSTHVHLLIRSHPTTILSRLLQRLKGGTAYRINSGTATRAVDLRWAKGYSVHSVSTSGVKRAADYVRNQHLRHPDLAICDYMSQPQQTRG
jgi:REP element-mobilizing transposase RayT